MKLSELQTRSWPLRTEGAVTDLLNSRPDALDCYHPVPRPLCLGGSGRRILGLDRRGDVENVISLDPSLGALYLEGVIDRFDVYADRSEMLCGDAGDVREVSHCGDYLVCRRADATLYFLRWSDAERDYTPIGEMPTALDFTVERVPVGTMSFAIPATEWGVKAADLRSSIPDQARRRTAEAVRRAWADAVDSATRAGYLLQPTTVRVMARLWDGSVFCVSESVRVPGADWQGYDRFRGDSNVRTWVYRVSLNTCISYKRKKRVRTMPLDLSPDILNDSTPIGRQNMLLHERITRLEPFDRAIILLWLEDMSYEEIAAIVGITVKALAVRLVRIRQKLISLNNETSNHK